METELPAKGDIREAVAPFGPGAAEKKLIEHLGEDRMELLRETKKMVNPTDKPLKLLYFASGPDIANPIVATGATTLIFIDRENQLNAIKNEISRIGGELKKEPTTSGNRTEIDFEFDGKSRKLLFYQLSISKETVDQLPKEMKDCDVYFIKKPQDVRGFEAEEKAINSLKKGGFYVSDGEVDNALGFEEVHPQDKFKTKRFGYGHLHLHRKTMQTPKLKEIMGFNNLLFDTAAVRDGSLFGISDQDIERTTPLYQEMLGRLKESVNLLPDEVKGELKQRVVDRLVNTPGDMSKVFDSPENWRKQYSDLQSRFGRALPQEEVEHFDTIISDAESSPNRPTAQQLEKFIEEGKKVFKEVFPDGV